MKTPTLIAAIERDLEAGHAPESNGAVSEIITWKLRLFVPTSANGPAVLAELMERYPVVRVADQAM